MLADEDRSCTGNLSTYEREESWIMPNEEGNLTNDLCQLSMFARMISGLKKKKSSKAVHAQFSTSH